MTNIIRTLSISGTLERITFSSITPPFDTDATAFFTAASITDTVQKIAINQLIFDLKLFGLWTKCIAIYPFVGGTASTHKWNLKDARDLDAAYRLVFSGGWTHSATGALPNGTTGYADTKIGPSTSITTDNLHASFYSRTNTTVSAPWEMGTQNGTVLLLLGCGRTLDNLTLFAYNGSSYSSSIITPYNGLFLGSKIASGNSNIFMYRNGNLLSSGTGATSGTAGSITANMFIGAANNGSGTAVNFSQKECAFASIGTNFSATEAANFYTCIQKYQGTLNRAIYG